MNVANSETGASQPPRPEPTGRPFYGPQSLPPYTYVPGYAPHPVSDEAWESLWHASGRRGAIADFLKGLIKLAAALVKAREGNPRGVTRHANRARELYAAAKRETDDEGYICGLNWQRLDDMATSIATSADSQFQQPNPTYLDSRWLELRID